MIMYVIGITDSQNPNSYNHFVEEVIFRNIHFGDFRNAMVHFTDDMRYALHVKSKQLANILAECVRKSIPKLFVEVIKIEL